MKPVVKTGGVAVKKSALTVAPSGRLRAGDEVYLHDLREALLAQSAAGANWILYVLGALLVAALVWAAFARVEEVTVGTARIVSASREQLIQSLEGGILEDLEVKEGDEVQKGQVLLRIDATRADAVYGEALSKVIGLKATLARLRAEAFSAPLAFPPEVQAYPAIVRDETQAYQTRKRALDEAISGLREGLALTEKEIAMAQPLAAKGLYPEVDLLRTKRQANDIRLQMTERLNRYHADANTEMVRMEMELAQASENIKAREDMRKRTVLRAPMRGIVKNIRVTTIGGVIAQGASIMEIVPLDDQLLVEAKIRPSDVAFLRPGLPAMVKISAYDYAVYGGMEGEVELISPDTLHEEKRAANAPDESYYRVLVRTRTAALNAGGKLLPVIPGMTALVEIRTGEKTILDYLLKPVMKSREAFRER